MTRLCTVGDLPLVVALCDPLIRESTHPGAHINVGFFLEQWTGMLRNGSAFIAGRFEGERLVAVSGMVLCRDLLTGYPHAQQALVGVHPSKRGFGFREVFEYAHEEAYRRGAKYIAVTRATETESGPRMDRFYGRHNYRAVQITLLHDLCLSSQERPSSPESPVA